MLHDKNIIEGEKQDICLIQYIYIFIYIVFKQIYVFAKCIDR